MKKKETSSFKISTEATSVGGNQTIKDPRGEIADGDNFLLDFIKNKKWVDRDAYQSNNLNENNDDDEASNDSDESLKDLDRMDEFESKYNFRFEEASSSQSSGALQSVVGYSRSSLSNTVRKKDDSRKIKREQRKERKMAERKAKEEQLKRLKNAKREELESRITQIKEAVGAPSSSTDYNERQMDDKLLMKLMEGDYNPDKFGDLMSKLYSEDFYQEEDADWKTDLDVKNSLKKVEENGEPIITEAWDTEGGDLYDHIPEEKFDNDIEENEEYDFEDENYNQVESKEEDAALDTQLKSKMLDELYKLDYEDVVAGIPTRFKYREVEPNNYGLATEEILFSRDTTLKQFVGLSRMAPYNDGQEYFPGTKKRKRFRELAKQDMEEMEVETVRDGISIENDVVDDSGDANPKKKKRHRRKKKKRGTTEEKIKSEAKEEKVSESKELEVTLVNKDNTQCKAEVENQEDVLDATSKESRRKKKKDGKRKKKKKISGKVDGISSSRLASYGI